MNADHIVGWALIAASAVTFLAGLAFALRRTSARSQDVVDAWEMAISDETQRVWAWLAAEEARRIDVEWWALSKEAS